MPVEHGCAKDAIDDQQQDWHRDAEREPQCQAREHEHDGDEQRDEWNVDETSDIAIAQGMAQRRFYVDDHFAIDGVALGVTCLAALVAGRVFASASFFA